MKIISHRGNLRGPKPDKENNPIYIQEALDLGFDVEIDIWQIEKKLLLGHDEPVYPIDFKWLAERDSNLWIHAKNFEVLFNLLDEERITNLFWHQEDKFTLTKSGYIWAYPGQPYRKKSIVNCRNEFPFGIDHCHAICTDYPTLLKK